MRLEEIGFYTLSDARADSASETSPLARCEVLLTERCNFRCPYCRRVGGPDADPGLVLGLIKWLGGERLRAVRFSGGEPTLHGDLPRFVEASRAAGIARVAVSTNGSAPWSTYEDLLARGADDFSVSLDACCAADGDAMAGGVRGSWRRVVGTIRRLAARAYVTVGVVVTERNAATVARTVDLAVALGAADVRVIPAAQEGEALSGLDISDSVLSRCPILRYRVGRARAGLPVRGLGASDSRRCRLALDDMAVMGAEHYPCIIYLREGGAPVGKLGADVRMDRASWSLRHDTHADPICRANCLDVCVAHNNRGEAFDAEPERGAGIYHG